MMLGTRYLGIDLRTAIDAQGVKVAWWCIWYPTLRHPTTRLGYLYGSVRNALPEPAVPHDPWLDPVKLSATGPEHSFWEYRDEEEVGY